MSRTGSMSRGPVDCRTHLAGAGFIRVERASEASISRLTERLEALAPLITSLPDLDTDQAMVRINEELTELALSPSVVDHDGVGPHLHWTASTATFDDQVMADILMALAQELCDSGAIRFGRCDAEGCARLFFDGTRNRSRRFCSDPRCASRTHTADDRARRQGAGRLKP